MATGDSNPLVEVHRVARSGDLGPDVTPAMRLVLIMLAGFADRATGEAYPSLDSLVIATGFTRNTVRAALKDLEAQGLIAVLSRGGGRRSARYALMTRGSAIAPLGVSHCPPGGQLAIGGGQPLPPRGSTTAPDLTLYLERN